MLKVNDKAFLHLACNVEYPPLHAGFLLFSKGDGSTIRRWFSLKSNFLFYFRDEPDQVLL